MKKLVGLGEYVIVEKVEQKEKSSGSFEVVDNKSSLLSKGNVIADNDCGLSVGDEVIFFTDKASEFGFEFPSNVVFVSCDDMIGGYVDTYEAEDEEEDEFVGVN